EQAVAAVALVYVPFGVLLLMEAEPAIRLLYGSAYAAAGAPIARWLAPAPLLFAMSYLGAYALLAQDRRWAMFGTSFAAAAFNVGANFLLIPSLSGTGAAIATTTSFGVETVATLALLVPAVGWVRLDRALVLPAVASAAMAVALATLRTNVLVEAAVGGVVYLGVWYVLARWRSPDQLAIIRSVIPWRR
ncbi:MAG TPA: polysaccharide biosynthesis C-terminal domain-containing protein, partial [Actinomycetota bacterium]